MKWTAHRQPLRNGLPTVMSLTVVTDTGTGLPLGLVESAPLTATRTAAASALALLHAAPAAVRRVALLGAGAQATAHLRMLAAVFPGMDAVTAWNRTPARVHAMLAGPALPWPVSIAQTPGAAVADADAVPCCTAATRLLLDAAAMRPGRIVLQVGYNEVTFEAIDRADAVTVDLWGEIPPDQRQKPVPDAPGWTLPGVAGGGRPTGAGAGAGARHGAVASIFPPSA